jgi:hypothetical protein
LTPEFLVWSLEYLCPIRGLEDGCDPERTERHLRAARAASDALVEGRVVDGLALDPPLGFRLADALAIYGGEAALTQHCRGCPANTNPAPSPEWAGCFGMMPLPAHDDGLYRLVMESPLLQPQLHGLAEALEGLGEERSLAELRRALDVAREIHLPLHVRLFPAGRVEGTWWRLEPHCPRCKAPWSAGANRCGVCQHAGHPAADKKRRARGTRPYFPLDRLLGRAADVSLLRSTAAALPDLPRCPPPPEPPGNPPAD